MRSQYDHLKNHYKNQKQTLKALRDKQLSIAKEAKDKAKEEMIRIENALKEQEGKADENKLQTQLQKAALRLKEEEMNYEDIKKTIDNDLNKDLEKLDKQIQEQMAHPAPLTDQTVGLMDLSNYEKFDQFDPEGHKCMGYYRVNGRHFALWQSDKEKDMLRGTTRTNPLYDDTALKTMYGAEYFGDKATLQVGIPDRGEEEVLRRKGISEMQVEEWKAAGITVEGKRVVEIGGGSGYLSEEIKNKGGKPLNVELCEERCDSCRSRDIEAYNGFLHIGVANNAENLQYKSADVVACYDLLEHIVNPHEGFIQAVNAVLKEGGHLCIRVPEGTEPTLHLIDHVNHFSFHSLKKFLEHFGFEYVPRPEPKEPKFEQPGEGKRYSGTFREGGFKAEKGSAQNPENKEFRTMVPDSKAQEGKKPARKPIEERTIENMTVYFRKIKDCDYSILDKFKVSVEKLKF